MSGEPTVRLRDRVWQALEQVRHPVTGRSIVAEGLVPHVAECGGRVAVSLRFEALPRGHEEALASAVRQAVESLEGVRWVRLRPAR